MNQVCFVCEWNEGRSVHLELVIRQLLNQEPNPVRLMSAGLRQGGQINPMRCKYLQDRDVPQHEIARHRSVIFNAEHARSDLVLVSEVWMKDELLERWPDLHGRVMTVRGYIGYLTPATEKLEPSEAEIQDAAGQSDERKLELYVELDELAALVAERLR